MSQTVTNVCCSMRETICSSCLEVILCAQSDGIESLQSFDCFHRRVTPYLTACAVAA